MSEILSTNEIGMQCHACRAQLLPENRGGYVFCVECGSANFSSDRNAEDDNNDYFNEHFANLGRNNRFRSLLFSIFNKIHYFLNFGAESIFKKLIGEIDQYFSDAKVALEIGFGGGDELIKRLDDGCNCFGLDLSITAVESFKKRYPQYVERVSCDAAGNGLIGTNLIYSNALFEHLDNPNFFLKAAYDQLETGGHLILRLPLLKNPKLYEQEPIDINFWEPCHRWAVSSSKCNRVSDTEFISPVGFGIKSSLW